MCIFLSCHSSITYSLRQENEKREHIWYLPWVIHGNFSFFFSVGSRKWTQAGWWEHQNLATADSFFKSYINVFFDGKCLALGNNHFSDCELCFYSGMQLMCTDLASSLVLVVGNGFCVKPVFFNISTYPNMPSVTLTYCDSGTAWRCFLVRDFRILGEGDYLKKFPFP